MLRFQLRAIPNRPMQRGETWGYVTIALIPRVLWIGRWVLYTTTAAG